MGKIKKGREKFRGILTRKQDFVTREMINKWNKALHTDLVTEVVIRNAYKMFHIKEFKAQERDKILKLLTRKTLFNKKGFFHVKLLPLLWG